MPCQQKCDINYSSMPHDFNSRIVVKYHNPKIIRIYHSPHILSMCLVIRLLSFVMIKKTQTVWIKCRQVMLPITRTARESIKWKQMKREKKNTEKQRTK